MASEAYRKMFGHNGSREEIINSGNSLVQSAPASPKAAEPEQQTQAAQPFEIANNFIPLFQKQSSLVKQDLSYRPTDSEYDNPYDIDTRTTAGQEQPTPPNNDTYFSRNKPPSFKYETPRANTYDYNSNAPGTVDASYMRQNEYGDNTRANAYFSAEDAAKRLTPISRAESDARVAANASILDIPPKQNYFSDEKYATAKTQNKQNYFSDAANARPIKTAVPTQAQGQPINFQVNNMDPIEQREQTVINNNASVVYENPLETNGDIDYDQVKSELNAQYGNAFNALGNNKPDDSVIDITQAVDPKVREAYATQRAYNKTNGLPLDMTMQQAKQEMLRRSFAYNRGFR